MIFKFDTNYKVSQLGKHGADAATFASGKCNVSFNWGWAMNMESVKVFFFLKPKRL